MGNSKNDPFNKFILDGLKLRKLDGKRVTLVTTNGNLTQIIYGLLKKDSDKRYHHYSSIGKKRIHVGNISECVHYKIGDRIYEGRIVMRPKIH